MNERTLRFKVGDEVIYLGHYGIHDMEGGTDHLIGEQFIIDLASIHEGSWDYVLGDVSGKGVIGAMDDEVTGTTAHKLFKHLRGLYE